VHSYLAAVIKMLVPTLHKAALIIAGRGWLIATKFLGLQGLPQAHSSYEREFSWNSFSEKMISP